MKIYSHEKQMLHDPKAYYARGKIHEPQEKPIRLTELLKAPTEMGLDIIDAKDNGIEPILAIHDFGYVEFLRNAYQEWSDVDEPLGEEVQTSIYVPHNNAGIGIFAKAAKYQADGSAPIGPHSWESIYWSAQTAMSAAVDLLANFDVKVKDDSSIKKSASENLTKLPIQLPIYLCLTRPAGHHARKSAAGGFCYLNNAAIVAQHLRQKYQKICVFDTDMHHGQGVQELFYDRDDVLYTSVHGSPINFYPAVSGHENERGTGKGLGYNINFPMPHGTDESGFFAYIDKALASIELYNPDVIVNVLGFDIYKDDPQARCHVDTQGFTMLAKRLKSLNKPLIILVEGGYCIEKLNENLQAFIRGLQD